MPALLVIADDLTGAADTGVRFTRAGRPTRLLLDTSATTYDGAHDGVLVVDTDSRHLPPEAARAAVRGAAARFSAPIVFKKVDSLLRGPLAAEFQGLLDARRALVVLAPALPEAGRSTVDGVQHVDGTPLHRTDAWALEPRTPAPDLAGLLDPLGVTHADLATVRGDLSAAIEGATTPVLVCDAVTGADLAAIARAGLRARRPVCLSGSAGLAGALAAALSGSPRGDARPEPPDGHYLAVVGSASPAALAQADELAARGARLLLIPVADLLAGRGGLAARIGRAVLGGDTVVRVAGRVDPAVTGEVAAALAAVTAPTAARTGLLVLTGGATARGVLTGTGVSSLCPLAEPVPGAVVSTDPATGRLIITKAGSFGDRSALARAVSSVRSPQKEPAS